jgi:hypothetical protein
MARSPIKILAVCYGLTAAASGYASGGIEATAIDPSVSITEIFNYVDGREAVNLLSEYSDIQLSGLPIPYASEYEDVGRSLVLFGDDGAPVLQKPGAAAGGVYVEYFPSRNGEYFLEARRLPYYEPDFETAPVERTYYEAPNRKLWEDTGDTELSWGLVCVSPDGERIVYVRRGVPEPHANLIFRDQNGTLVSTGRVGSPGLAFNFTADSEYFLISEDFRPRPGGEFGTAVYDRDGRFLFYLEPDKVSLVTAGAGYNSVGGDNGLLVQVCYYVERQGTPPGTEGFIPLYEKGVGVQVYAENGAKKWEYFSEKPCDGFFALSENGAFLVFARGLPPRVATVFEADTGNVLRTLSTEGLGKQYPEMTISDDGALVCVSTPTKKPVAFLYSGDTLIARFVGDRLGAFRVNGSGDLVSFSGDNALTVYELDTGR